jgi:hypothetical protein
MSAIGPFEEAIPRDVLKSVSEVVPRVQIGEVRLDALASKRASVVPEPGSEVTLTTNHGAGYRLAGQTRLDARVRFSVKASAPDTPEAEFFTLTAVYYLMYESGSSLADVAPDKLKAFIGVNAVHNAWPYWRELVQSTMTRMGLPPVTVPLLKLRAPSQSAAGATTSATTGAPPTE